MRDRPIYRIDHIPATGAYSTIVVAEDARGEMVALKVLRRDLVKNPEAVDRTYDEARMLSSLRHPNILRVDDVVHISGRPVVVMEWVRGVSLDRILQRHSEPIPTREAVEIARQTALALHAAYHHRGPDAEPMLIVHRDVKPSNIMLSADGQVKLGDFGVAKGEFIGRQSDSMYFVHGSLSYTAPERLDGVPDGPHVDVYALGLSLFELATGRQMILSRAEERHDDGLDKHLDHLADPSLAAAEVAALRAVIRSMCCFDHKARLTPEAAASALGAWLDGLERGAALDAWAWERVVPILREQMGPPHEHPAYKDVAFLEEATLQQVTEEALRVEQRTTAELDAWLGGLLRAPGWTERAAEIKAATRHRDDWGAAPLLAVLSRARVPWWRVWARPAAAEELAVALDVLRDRHEPGVVLLASQLQAHPDERVAVAARRLLKRARKAEGGA